MITSRACRINAQTDLRACASSKGKGVVLKEFKDGHPSGHPQDSRYVYTYMICYTTVILI